MQIGQVIREHRKRLGMTQEQMADRLGVTAPAVNKWERGVTAPDIGLLCPIARLLESRDEDVRRQAAEALFRLHMWWGEYEDAGAFFRDDPRWKALAEKYRAGPK